MKKIIFLGAMVLLLVSCATSKQSYSPISVYSNIEDLPEVTILPVNLIFNTQTMEYVEVSSMHPRRTIGSFQINGDTLRLFPAAEIFKRFGDYSLSRIDCSDENALSISTIPLTYIIKKDGLFDITDYLKYMPSMAQYGLFAENQGKMSKYPCYKNVSGPHLKNTDLSSLHPQK